SINFFFDTTAGDVVLYRSEARVNRPQRDRDLTFVFAPLRLEARENYRIVLVGDRDAQFSVGETVGAELYFNPGGGYTGRPERTRSYGEIDGQRNIAIDFSAPGDINLLNDIRVTVQHGQPIRSAILYVRARFVSSSASVPERHSPIRPSGGGQARVVSA